MVRYVWLFSLLVLLCALSAMAGPNPSPSPSPSQTLQLSDCPKCHEYEVESLNLKGGRHRSEVTCIDCHDTGHPPKGRVVIPACTQCHSGEPHFTVANCSQCHTVAHMPLASLKFPPTAKEGCISCHKKEGEELAEAKSKHASHACAFCHTVHKEIPSCLDCHTPHLPEQVMADCRPCHAAHSPNRIVPPVTASNKICQTCHADEAEKLSKTKTQHGLLTCVSCHQGQHPAPLPKCQDCHGTPHGWGMLNKGGHKKCLDCHMNPHALLI